MGMFDYLKVSYPLPDGYVSEDGFQTKDLSCTMEEYEITAEGRLIEHQYDYESTPEDELPYKNDPRPFMRLCGSIRRVAGSCRIIDLNYHGYLDFYDIDDENKLRRYTAKFTGGKIVSIEKRTD